MNEVTLRHYKIKLKIETDSNEDKYIEVKVWAENIKEAKTYAEANIKPELERIIKSPNNELPNNLEAWFNRPIISNINNPL